jgi:hypothetical protein
LVASLHREYRHDDDSDDRSPRAKPNQSAMPWTLAGIGGGALVGVALVIAQAMNSGSESKPKDVVQRNPPQRNSPVTPAKESPQQMELPQGPGLTEIAKAANIEVKKPSACAHVEVANGMEAQSSGIFADEKGLFSTNAHVLGMLKPSAPSPSAVDNNPDGLTISSKTDPNDGDTKTADPKRTDAKKSDRRSNAKSSSRAQLPSVRPEQTPGYTPVLIHGFTVIVSQEALRRNNDSTFEFKPLDLLSGDLKTISKIMPPPALSVLRRVLIWVEWNEKVPATNGRTGNAVAFYAGGHQMQLWKEGRHPLQAQSVIVNDLKTFSERRQTDKSLRYYILLHEMAHAVHDQMLGADNPNLKAVYKQALERKLLDPSAYAATNVQEFFAEMTCAYFDQLPYHPRTRADLKKHDAVTFKLMETTWGKSKVETGEPAKPVTHVQAPPLNELALGQPAMGAEVTAPTLRGRPSLVIYWNAHEPSSLLCLTKVASWDAELRDFGLVTVAVHLEGKTAVDAKAKAQARHVAFAVNLDKWTADSLVTDFKDFPLALVYGHDGNCVFRGNPFEAEAAVRQAVGAALVAELTQDVLPQPLVPVVDALANGKAPKTQFAKLLALTKSKTDMDAAQLAKKLLAKLTEAAASTLDRAETMMQADPVEAFVMAEPLTAAFKGTAVAARAGSLLAKAKQTKEVGLELKARGVLATVKKLEAYLDSVPGSFDPARPKYREDNAQALHQVEAAIFQMKRSWPQARATQLALRVAQKFALTVP